MYVIVLNTIQRSLTHLLSNNSKRSEHAVSKREINVYSLPGSAIVEQKTQHLDKKLYLHVLCLYELEHYFTQ